MVTTIYSPEFTNSYNFLNGFIDRKKRKYQGEAREKKALQKLQNIIENIKNTVDGYISNPDDITKKEAFYEMLDENLPLLYYYASLPKAPKEFKIFIACLAWHQSESKANDLRKNRLKKLPINFLFKPETETSSDAESSSSNSLEKIKRSLGTDNTAFLPDQKKPVFIDSLNKLANNVTERLDTLGANIQTEQKSIENNNKRGFLARHMINVWRIFRGKDIKLEQQKQEFAYLSKIADAVAKAKQGCVIGKNPSEEINLIYKAIAEACVNIFPATRKELELEKYIKSDDAGIQAIATRSQELKAEQEAKICAINVSVPEIATQSTSPKKEVSNINNKEIDVSSGSSSCSTSPQQILGTKNQKNYDYSVNRPISRGRGRGKLQPQQLTY